MLAANRMVVLDCFHGHTDGRVKSSADVCINKPLKANLKDYYTQSMAKGEHPYMPSGKIKQPKTEMICDRIKTACTQISSDLIMKIFQKYCISNTPDSSDNILWDDDLDASSGDADDDD